MMNLLRRMKPENLGDLIHALALIRPGPTESGMKEAFLRRREGRASPPDPFLAKILPETGGLMFYEEQVMQVAERVAGFPPEEGELLRRQLKSAGWMRLCAGNSLTGPKVVAMLRLRFRSCGRRWKNFRPILLTGLIAPLMP